jgi:hypothetical protein
MRDEILPTSLPSIRDNPSQVPNLINRAQNTEINDMSESEVGVVSVRDDISAFTRGGLSFGEVVR